MKTKILILLALTVLTAANIGCTRCRNFFRRGSPCGGTALTAPPMLGAIPLGNPVSFQQAPQIVPQNIIVQPGYCCEQTAPICCEPCPDNCGPCESGYIGADWDCNTAPGEIFGGYVEGSEPQGYQGTVVPQGSGTLPQPTP